MTEDEDAQRILERKAVANARGLVEKLEAQERDKAVDPVRLLLLSLVVVAIAAALTFAWQYYRRPAPAPEMKPTSAMTADEYARQALARIEWFGNNNKSLKALIAPLHGRLEFTMAIDARGYIRSLELTKPSFDATFDRQASAIIKFSEPFGPLPDSVRKSSDELRVTRALRIGPSKSGEVAVSIEGEGAK